LTAQRNCGYASIIVTFDELRARREEILEVVYRHGGIPPVRVFGSVARGEAAPGSDVDLLVELEPGRSLL
jgi:predicted nucleotidyltransferase